MACGGAGVHGGGGVCGGVSTTHSLVPMIFAVGFAVVCVNAMIGPYWAMPTSILSGAAAAPGIAFVNSIGNLGGFFGPWVIGTNERRRREIFAGDCYRLPARW